jgi:hypothetical protein
MAFIPASAGIGQVVEITVTSARASANVSLTGPWNPTMTGTYPGGRGTIWVWRIIPLEPGQFTYNFTIGGNVCAVGSITVGLGR